MPGTLVFPMTNHAATGVEWRRADDNRSCTAAQGKHGVCISMVLMWIRQTILHGNLNDASRIAGDMHVITLRQSVMQYNTRANRRVSADARMSVRGDLFAQYELREVASDTRDLFSFEEAADTMKSVSGYYSMFFRKEGVGGHAFGFKLMGGNDPSYFFDPNAGLYRFDNADELAFAMLSIDDTGYGKYLGDSYTYSRVQLG